MNIQALALLALLAAAWVEVVRPEVSGGGGEHASSNEDAELARYNWLKSYLQQRQEVLGELPTNPHSRSNPESVDGAALSHFIQNDKIKVALRRYVDDDVFGKIKSLNADNESNQDLDMTSTGQQLVENWLESTIPPPTNRANHKKIKLDDQHVADPYSHLVRQKMIRNIQPVLMRLPPRFGKRSPSKLNDDWLDGRL